MRRNEHRMIAAVIASAALFPIACRNSATDADAPVRALKAADTGCVDGVDSYIDENGDQIECVYTDTTLPPPDPCLLYPDYCYPPDPCDVDPTSCTSTTGDSTGGGTEPVVCDASVDVPADLQQAVNDRVGYCFQQNWSTLPFVEKTDTVNYSPGSGGYTYSILDWLQNNITACVVQNWDWLFYSNSTGGQIMQNLVGSLNEMAKSQNLTPHQKICSALCVSGRLITYSTQNWSTVLPSSAVTSGIGMCREFAQIGERLLDGMGFSSSTVGSTAQQHAFLEVTSPAGGSFYVEPQTSDCVFYNRH